MKIFCFFIAAAALLFCGCPVTEQTDQTIMVTLPAPEEGGAPRLLDFGSAARATVEFNSIGHTLVLAKVNLGAQKVAYSKTGTVSASSGGRQAAQAAQNSARSLQTEEDSRGDTPAWPYKHHAPSLEFAARPLPASALQSARSVAPRQAAVAAVVGETRQFWTSYNNDRDFAQKQGTLMATSTHAEVWVLNNNSGQSYITTAQSQEIAQKFDLIYPLETALLGYEYGGGPGGAGGVDGIERIIILVYDIPDEGVIGYFWGKDYYTNAQLSALGYPQYKSNEAEIFYMDSEIYRTNPEVVYSTLVHEFQHMIHFNVKQIQQNLATSAWFNEMLSMVAEDVISPHIGIDPHSSGHPVHDRFGSFLKCYWASGITELDSSDPLVVLQYSNTYAFGAYLARNYGGAKLLQQMVQNNAIDEASILLAVKECSSSPPSTFDDIFINYVQTLTNNTSTGYSFNKTPPEYKPAAVSYKLEPINLLDNALSFEGPVYFNYNTFLSTMQTNNLSNTSIPARGIILEAHDTWKRITTPLRVTVNAPSDPNIRFYWLIL